jgi:CheY-like chemotaxis protein
LLLCDLAARGFGPYLLPVEKSMVEKRKKKTVLLMADDDEDDCLLMNEAVREIFKSEHFFCLPDGQELMDYLLRRGIYTNPKEFPAPDLIFLDLNMPKKDGFQTLKEIKEHPSLKAIPILIFSTAEEREQVELCYKLGANSYITKPMSFEDLVRTVRCLSEYWFGIAKLPPAERLCACLPCKDQPPPKCTF